MARRPSKDRKQLVENCAVISATPEIIDLCHRYRVEVSTTMPKPFKSFRYWFKCPICKRRAYKLYRPDPSSRFACRHCHGLTYRSAQTHDARLDRMVKLPADELASVFENGSAASKRLALRALEIKRRVSQSREKV